ncbi:hypothetical protein AXG93_4324s1500 [Marchantia polymorpha subsp. ruderalis]|uniref:Uncharacterized protein n=1 Tax=Marchantia polymorpha subsp. ruderalis TaxID=1480154 RepID=A0A176W1R4_MARPO|nr:hypothetical protein AXG93_4324s1500 [Marchantia polymorpha subsp. ruderalis]
MLAILRGHHLAWPERADNNGRHFEAFGHLHGAFQVVSGLLDLDVVHCNTSPYWLVVDRQHMTPSAAVPRLIRKGNLRLPKLHRRGIRAPRVLGIITAFTVFHGGPTALPWGEHTINRFHDMEHIGRD